jgi:outer membrane receptor protein involved in Fe transport
LFDLQQVEVLRGPQGILFGKNTLAGAINVSSKTPAIGDPTEGTVSLAAESDRGRIAEIGVSAPLGDTLAVRLAIKDRDSEGYNTNSYAGARDASMPSADETLWRISANWQPSDNLRVIAKHAQSEHQRVGSPAVISTFQQQANIEQSNAMMYYVIGNFFPELPKLVAQGAIDGYRDGVSIGGLALAHSLGRDRNQDDEKPEGTDTDTEDSSLTFDLDLPGGYTLTSVTGVAEYDYEDGIDADFFTGALYWPQ